MNTLVLSGGGMKGLLLLGGLHYLYTETDDMHAISTYSGTSVGAIICVLLVVGYTPFEIFQKTHSIRDFVQFDLNDVLMCKERYGLISNEKIVDMAMCMVHEKYPHIQTLGDVFTCTARTLHVCVTNLTQERVMYLNPTDNADVPLELALRMSCNLPGVFTRIEYEGDYMVDGGVVDNTPITPVNYPSTRAIVMRLVYDKFHPQTSSFLEYMYRCIRVGSKDKFEYDLSIFTGHVQLIGIVETNYSTVDFTMTLSSARRQFDDGYQQTFRQSLENEL